MMSLLKLLPMPPAEIVGGSVEFGGRDLLQLNLAELRDVRGGDIGFIFQDPMQPPRTLRKALSST